ncbi:MAG: RHS repeat-associated core domain-containing protein [Anaerolineae bacterium]|nr:RHS repeat-associated core domain-containing protein [Anaerolineae bacterium]
MNGVCRLVLARYGCGAEPFARIDGALPTDLQYTGQRRETGLGDIYDYKARFYSPKLGRFLSADTLVPGVGSQALNRYMYVNANPIRYNDPTGHALGGPQFDPGVGGLEPPPPPPPIDIVEEAAKLAVWVSKYVPVSLTLRATKKFDLSGAQNFYPNFWQRNFLEFHTEVGSAAFVDTTLYPGRPIEWNVSNGDINFSTTSGMKVVLNLKEGNIAYTTPKEPVPQKPDSFTYQKVTVKPEFGSLTVTVNNRLGRVVESTPYIKVQAIADVNVHTCVYHGSGPTGVILAAAGVWSVPEITIPTLIRLGTAPAW